MTPTLSIMTLAGILALTGGAIVLWILWNAFTDSIAQGLLSLLVPGYVIYYGFTRFSHARRKLLVTGALAAFLAAGLAWVVSTAFAPHATMAGAAAGRDMWSSLG